MSEYTEDAAKRPPTQSFENATPLLDDPQALSAKADEDPYEWDELYVGSHRDELKY
jgi:hypothetical protein